MKYLTKIILILFLLGLISCKKERKPLLWNVDALLPVFYGDLSINDILSDTLLDVNSDNSVQLKFSTNVYRLDFDSLVNIPDTTIEKAYTVPFLAGIDCSPGQTFVSEPEDVSLIIDEVELTQIKIKKGLVNYSISSNIQAEVIYDYSISNAYNQNGDGFVQRLTVPSSNSSNSVLVGSFDLSGYTIDLRGTNQNAYNTLSTLIQIKLSENHPGNITITNQDSVLITNSITDLEIEFAKGYFGNQLTTIASNKNELKQMESVLGGSIDLDQVGIDLSIVNGIGADATFSINNLNSISSTSNIPLVHSIIGSENNLNRAQNNGVDIIPYVHSTELNSNNSNIEQWIENLPDSIEYGLDLELNPLGNIAGHNDFIYSDSPFEINMGVDMPLSFVANELILVDTIVINVKDIENIIEGKLLFEIENGFPLNALLSLQNTEGEEELFANNIIESGVTDNLGVVSQPTTSKCEVVLSEEDFENLKTNSKLVLKIAFDSPSGYSTLNIYDYYRLKFKSVADFTYQNNIQ